MTEFETLSHLGYILLTAAAAVLVLRVVKVPTIVAYLAAGLLLGPATGFLFVTESTELISEVGIALLLFLVGLELSLDHIRGVGRVALLGGSIQIVATAAIGYGAAALFGFGAAEAMVPALAVTFSSTVVVVKLLGQARALSALHGRIAVGILLVQDVAVVLALTLFAGLGTGSGDDSGVGAVATDVMAAFAGMAALAFGAAAAAKWVLPRVFGWAGRSPATAFIWSLAWCFAFIMAAETVHLSVELGAFIAGVSLAQLDFAEAMRRRVQPIVTFFLAVFFVSLGLQMQPGAALERWPLVLALCVIVLLVKPVILMATVPRLGYGERTSFLASVTLGQMSEFSFILGGLAVGAGVLRPEIMSVIGVAGFITIGVSSYVIVGGAKLYDFLRGAGVLRVFRAGERREPRGKQSLEDHIIVVGINSLGARLVRLLAECGETILAIDTDPDKLHGLPSRTQLGTVDDLAVLEAAGFERAQLVMSALQIEDTNNLLAWRCRRADIPCAIHAFDTSLIEELRDIGVEYVIVPKHDGTRRIAQQLRQAGVLD